MSLYSDAVLADTPLWYVRADDTTPKAVDSGSDGTPWNYMSGATRGLTPLLSDGGFSFSGDGNGVQLFRQDVPLRLQGDSSYSFWVSLPSTNVKGGFLKIGTPISPGYGWGMGIGGTNVTNVGRTFQYWVEGASFNASSYVFPAGAGTYHILVTRSGNTVSLYVNGSATPNATTTLSAGNGIASSSNQSMDIGTNLDSGIKIDNFAMFEGALAASRAAAHYNSGTGSNSAITADNPVIWLKLDEAAGGTVATSLADSSGNGRSMSLTGSTSYGNVFFDSRSIASGGSALGFRAGSGSYGYFTTPSWALSLTDMSVEVWFKTTSSGSTQTLLSMDNVGNSPGGVDRKWQLYLDSTGKLTWMSFTTAGAFPFAASTASYNDGTWHHVVGTRTTTGMKLYVDGAQVGTQTISGTLSGTNVNLWMGATFNGASLYTPFTGRMDEPAIYGSELSAARVLAHFNAGVPAAASVLDTVYASVVTQGTAASALDMAYASVPTVGTPAARLSAASLAILRTVPSTWPPALPSATAASAPVSAFMSTTIMPDESGLIQSWVNQGSNRTDTLPNNTTTSIPTAVRNGTSNGNTIARFDGGDSLSGAGLGSASGAAQTLMAVIKPTGSFANWRTVWGSGGTSGGLQWRIDSTGAITLVKQGIAVIATSSLPLSLNQWVVVAATYTDNGTYAFYVNGYLINSGVHSTTLTAGAVRYLGGLSNSEFFLGDMASAAAWDRVLTGSEISTLSAELASANGFTATDPYARTMWLKADSITSPPSSGSNLTNWTDSSGNGYNATNSGNYPTYITNVLRSKPTARFGGSLFLNSSAPVDAPAQTVAAVIRVTGSGVRTIRGSLGGVNGNGGLQFRVESDNKLGLVAQNVAGIATSTKAIPQDVPVFVAATYTVGGAWNIWINGTLAGSGTSSQALTSGTTTTIGRNAINTEFFSGDMYELQAWNRVLSSTEMKTIYLEMFNKWLLPDVDIQSMTDKVLWLRAKELGAVNSSTVTTWRDNSGLSHDPTAFTGTTVATVASPNSGVVARLASANINLPDLEMSKTPSALPTVTVNANYNPTYAAGELIDGNTTGGWGWATPGAPTVGAPDWAKFQFGTAKVITSYQIFARGASDARAPKDFKFQGSNDNSNWTDLDTRTNVTWPTQAQNFTFSNPTAYTYYRLYITATFGNDITHLYEVTFNSELWSGATPGEMFLLLKSAPSASGAVAWKFGSSSSANHYPWSDGQHYTDFGRTVRTSYTPTSGTALINNWRLVRMKIDMFGAYSEYIDTVLQHSTNATIGWSGTPYLAGGYYADIAEVIMFRRTLSDVEVASVHNYLNQEHGTAFGVPVNYNVTVNFSGSGTLKAVGAQLPYPAAVLADGPDGYWRLNDQTVVTPTSNTGSSFYFNTPEARISDGSISPWITNGTSSGWIRFNYASPVVFTRYSIRATDDPSWKNRTPKTWTFEGTNDATFATWTTLDTQTNVPNTWVQGVARDYTFTNTTPYQWYRLNVSANNGDTYLEIAEVTLGYVKDYSGNSRDAVANGGITYQSTGLLPQTNPDNKSVTLNGSSGRINVPFSTWMNAFTTGLTVEAIVTPTPVASIVSIFDRDDVNGRNFQFRLNASGNLEFVTINGGAGVVTATSPGVVNSGPTHVAATYDGSNIRLYIQGVLVKTQAAAGTLSTQLGGIGIGHNWSGGSPSNFFSGKVQEAAYYTKVLTGTQIANHATLMTPASNYNGTAAFTGSGTLSATGLFLPGDTEDSYSTEVKADSPQAYWRFSSTQPLPYLRTVGTAPSYPETIANALYGGTYFKAGGSTALIGVELKTAEALTSYSFGCRTDTPARVPTVWTFEGSMDDTTYDILDSRTGISWTAGEKKNFTFSNTTSYNFYRLNVSAIAGGDGPGLYDLHFGGKGSPFSLDAISGKKMEFWATEGQTLPTHITPGAIGTGQSQFFGNGFAIIRPAAWMDSTTVTLEGVFTRPETSSGNLFDHDDETGGGRVYQVQVNANGGGTFVWFTSTVNYLNIPTGTFSADTPVHFAVTLDGTTVKIFRNGLKVASAPQNGTLNHTASSYIALGAHTAGQPWGLPGGFTQAFTGRMDEIAFYNTALSESRVAAHASAGGFDPGVGVASASLSGSGTLSAVGMQVWATTVNFTGSGLLSATGVLGYKVGAPFTGSGALTAGGQPGISDLTVNFSGSGTLTYGNVKIGYRGNAAFSAEGTLSYGDVKVVIPVQIALSGTGVLGATGIKRLNFDAKRWDGTQWVQAPDWMRENNLSLFERPVSILRWNGTQWK